MSFPCIPSSSVEYVSVPVTGDYTESMTVQMAIVAYGVEPGTSDWKTAAWDDGNARILLGAGTAVGELDEGMYGVWVKVTATGEAPVMYSGGIRIT
jgi:hypothetical protein